MTRLVSPLVIAAALMATGAYAQTAPQPGAQDFQVGALTVTALHDADFNPPNDGKAFGLGQSVEAIGKVLTDHGAPATPIHLSVDALLVHDGARLVLIDTGFGGALQAILAKAGITADAVTDVLITHAHPDHIGGLMTKDGKPAFPNAKVRMSEAEWASVKAQPDLAQFVSVVGPQVEAFTPGGEVAPGIASIALPGHTPGHTMYEIASGDAKLIDIGDTAHSSILSLEKPDWKIEFDGDQIEGAQQRRAELTRLAASGEQVFAPHFPFPGVGKIAADGDGFKWLPAQ
jgi:glyoxylase-like metal-dependent hydrolase (beta-lactamase superfamily II)